VEKWPKMWATSVIKKLSGVTITHCFAQSGQPLHKLLWRDGANINFVIFHTLAGKGSPTQISVKKI
jgi:hypothetical protein